MSIVIKKINYSTIAEECKLISKKIILIVSLVSVTMIIGLSMISFLSSDNQTQLIPEKVSIPSFQYTDSSIEEKVNKVGLLTNEFKAIRTIQEYQGIDKEGKTIEELTTYITESLLRDEKKTYPSTNFGWTGSQIHLGEEDYVYQVIYKMQTNEQKFDVIYNINLETSEIWGENAIAKDILALADMPESKMKL